MERRPRNRTETTSGYTRRLNPGPCLSLALATSQPGSAGPWYDEGSRGGNLMPVGEGI